MRGITPVIAIVLLLMMTIAAAAAAYIWIVFIQQKIQSASSTSIETIVKQVQFKIDICQFNSSGYNGTKFVLYVRNTGPVAIPAANATLVYDSRALINETPPIGRNEVAILTFFDSEYKADETETYQVRLTIVGPNVATEICYASQI